MDAGIARGFAGNLGEELRQARPAKLIPHLNAAACLREVAVGLLRANVATVQLPEDSVHRQESRAASGPAVAPRLDHGRSFAERAIWAGMVFRTTQRAGPLARSDTDHAAPPCHSPPRTDMSRLRLKAPLGCRHPPVQSKTVLNT